MNAHPNTGDTALRPADWTNVIIVFKRLEVAFLRGVLLSKVGNNLFDLKRRRYQTISDMDEKGTYAFTICLQSRNYILDRTLN